MLQKLAAPPQTRKLAGHILIIWCNRRDGLQ